MQLHTLHGSNLSKLCNTRISWAREVVKICNEMCRSGYELSKPAYSAASWRSLASSIERTIRASWTGSTGLSSTRIGASASGSSVPG